MSFVAAPLAALGLQEASAGVGLVAFQWVWLELWSDPQQTSGEAAPLAMVASVAASLAAQDPQLTPDGAALVALVVGNHRQALCGAALVTLVALGRLHRGYLSWPSPECVHTCEGIISMREVPK